MTSDSDISVDVELPDTFEGGQRLVVQEQGGSALARGAAAAKTYVVRTEQGAEIGRIRELSEGFVATVLRWIFTERRPFHMILESGAATLLELRRPWFWFLSTLFVSDGTGRAVGRIHQRFAFANRHFEIFGADDRHIGDIRGPWRQPWSFEILVGDREVARIDKRWSGIQELFSGANTFSLVLPADGDAVLSRLVVAAALLIDFCHFQDRSGTNGLGPSS